MKNLNYIFRPLTDIYIIWKKDMQIWLRNPIIGVMRSFIFASVFLLVFANAIGGKIMYIPIALVIEDNSEDLKLFTTYLTENHVFSIRGSFSHKKALDLLKSNKVYAVIYLSDNFPEKIYIYTDASSPNIISAIRAQIKNAYNNFVTHDLRHKHIVIEEKTVYGGKIEYFDFLVASAIIMTVILTSIFAGGFGIFTEKLQGSLHALYLTPISTYSIIVAKLLSGVTQASTGGIIALLIAYTIGANIKADSITVLSLILMIIILSFAAIGLSLAVASRVNNLQVFILSFQMLILPAWVLSGALYPIETLPSYLKYIPPINPLYYANDALRVTMTRGLIIDAIWSDLLFLILFTLLMVLAGTLSLKRAI